MSPIRPLTSVSRAPDTPAQWLDPVTGLTIDIEIDQLTLAWQNSTMAGLTDIGRGAPYYQQCVRLDRK